MTAVGTGEPLRVLFVCVHNAGRSQMAAAFARRLGGERLRVGSAGSTPAEAVHPVVVEAMLEVGVDLSTASPRGIDEAELARADVVVTMGCGDACPVGPGRREDWRIEDPKGKDLAAVRRIRDRIETQVGDLLARLDRGEKVGVAGRPPPGH